MHPADELGKSLSQARGIITSMVNCFDKTTSSFVTGPSFVAEAMTVVEDILSKASSSLSDLYENYDLNHVEDPIELSSLRDVEIHNEPIAENEIVEEEYKPSSFGLSGRGGSISAVTENGNSNLETFSKSRSTEPMRPEAMVDQPAQNYDELLEKLTAMADSAAYHTQKNNVEETSLLPVLEGLRADLLRMRSVA